MTLSLNPNEMLDLAKLSSITLAGAEISAFDPATDTVFVTSNAGLQLIDFSDPASPTLTATINFTAAPFNLTSTDVSSVAVKNGIVAVAVLGSPKTAPGHVVLIDATGALIGTVQVGANPDMVTFTPDGSKVLVANEGEMAAAGDLSVDPEGSVSLIDISNLSAISVATADFTAFNAQAAALEAEGVRLFAGEAGTVFAGTTVAQDLEPEYIAIAPDGLTAFVTLQEANAIAILDIATGTFTDIVPLGLKSWSGLSYDASDRDSATSTADIDLKSGLPIYSNYMPDAIDSFTAGGRTYYVTANEGDDRDDFLAPDETIRAGNAAYDLDNTIFGSVTIEGVAVTEAMLKSNEYLGRLTVSNFSGLRGDTDGDGDIDQIIAYGGRSFSILDDAGNIIFDSGDHIDSYIAANFPALFDDTRSDNKGAEPESVDIAVISGRTYAMVGLERFNGTMIYDVTDPANVQFVNFATNGGDVAPEGGLFIAAADSPTGKDLYLVSNETSMTMTTYAVTEAPAFTLQLLHFSDAEGGLLASTTAPLLAGLVDAFEDDYVNSITLAGGDNFIPGPFFAAGADPAITAVLPGGNVQGRPDIAIHNAIGVQASTIGNHEFDFGSQGFRDAFGASGAWVGAQFPYLSSNLDFSGDSVLNPVFVNTANTAGLEEASALKGKIAPSAVITENGEKIGVVGITTQLLEQISSPTGTEVKGFPTGPGANGEVDNMALLAAQVQVYIDDLRAQGVNKIVLMSHLQLLGNEVALAPMLEGVDIILAAGSHTRLGDADDVAVAFPGHAANFAGTYPIVTAGTDGKTTVIVSTDGEYSYLGRLVVDFDADGDIIADNLAGYTSVNGAYAATEQNVADAWGVDVVDLGTTAFAEGTRAETVQDISDAVQAVITAKTSNVFGYSDVYLEGARAQVRNQETNLGNLTADANADAARDALGLNGLTTAVVSIKNGGGIRAQIGTVSSPDPVDGTVDFLPNPGGVVSQLDVENSLRFDNKLMVFDTTAQGLLNILNSPNALVANNGGYIQIGGVSFSYDPTKPAGSRVQDVVLLNEAGQVVSVIAEDGVVVPGAPALIQAVVLNFTANGGDGYRIKANAENFRYLLNDGTLSAPVDEALDFTSAAVVPVNAMGEQQAFADYMAENHATAETAFDKVDTTAQFDTRIQNLSVRSDGVLEQDEYDSFIGFANVHLGDATDETVALRGGDDQVYGMGGNDTLLGQAGNDYLSGGEGDDILGGGIGDDYVVGGAGDDTLLGGDGNDMLIGGAGGDKLNGGAGNDTLVGGVGKNFLAGGAGNDKFAFTSINDSGTTVITRDFIADFHKGEDLIDLSAIDAIVGGADDAFAIVGAFSGVAGQMVINVNAGSSIVQLDANGDSVVDMSFVVKGVTTLDATDFLL